MVLVRLFVKTSEDEKVKVGSLYIVTCKGGTIGSKGDHEVMCMYRLYNTAKQNLLLPIELNNFGNMVIDLTSKNIIHLN